MEFLPAVIRAEYRGDFRIHLEFNDGMERTVDFSQWLPELLRSLHPRRHERLTDAARCSVTFRR